MLWPVLLHSCWEDGRMINYSNIPLSFNPLSTLIFSRVQKSMKKSLWGALTLSLFCCGISCLPGGTLVWTFWIRICNDTEQSREDTAITEERTTDWGEDRAVQTHPLGSNDEPQNETPSSTKRGYMEDAFCFPKLSKFVTSVYHLHPSSINKHVVCGAFPGPPTPFFHWQQRECIQLFRESTVFCRTIFF